MYIHRIPTPAANIFISEIRKLQRGEHIFPDFDIYDRIFAFASPVTAHFAMLEPFETGNEGLGLSERRHGAQPLALWVLAVEARHVLGGSDLVINTSTCTLNRIIGCRPPFVSPR